MYYRKLQNFKVSSHQCFGECNFYSYQWLPKNLNIYFTVYHIGGYRKLLLAQSNICYLHVFSLT